MNRDCCTSDLNSHTGRRSGCHLQQGIHRTSNAPSPGQDMSVNHRSAHITVTQEFLDGADVSSALKQMSREGMAKSVWCGMLSNPGFLYRLLDLTLKSRRMEVVPITPAIDSINERRSCREDPLPLEVSRCVGVFPSQGRRKWNSGEACSKVLPMKVSDTHEVCCKWGSRNSREWRPTVPVSFTGSNSYLVAAKVDVLYAKLQTLKEPNPTSIEENRD